MAIRVEFYGIARQRAGVSELALDVPAGAMRLGDALAEVRGQLPQLGAELVSGSRLHESLTANLDGIRFVSDPATLIRDGQSLLILSADAGG
jgi:sulfur-carrier protein